MHWGTDIRAHAVSEFGGCTQCVQKAPCNTGEIAGYKVLSSFTRANEQPRMRWMLFLSRNTRIYFPITEAVPAANYAEWLPAWTEMLDSPTFGPVEVRE